MPQKGKRQNHLSIYRPYKQRKTCKSCIVHVRSQDPHRKSSYFEVVVDKDVNLREKKGIGYSERTNLISSTACYRIIVP